MHDYAVRNGASTPSPPLARPAVNDLGWEQRQILAEAPPPPPQSGSVARHVGRPLASRSARLLAVLLDGFLFFLLWAAGQYVLNGLAEHRAWRTLLVGLVIGCALALGLGQMLLLARRGQTIGKLVLGIRIIGNYDESNPGFWRACVRSLIPWLIAGIPVLGHLFALFDLLSIFGEDRRCLHDLLADTKVVEV